MATTMHSEPAGRSAAVPARLRTEGLSVRYGGHHALDHFDLTVSPGQIVSLIGGNGAGKSSALNAISGTVRATGRVMLDGRDMSHEGPVARARAGLARTFQLMETFDDLSVLDNLIVVRELQRPLRIAAGLVTPPSTSGSDVADALAVLDRLGIARYARKLVGEVPTGVRRLVELGRVFVRDDARLLLLDEPSSGLDRRESGRFNDVVRSVCAERSDLSVLLVEHDMGVALELADEVCVLDFGRVLAVGTPAEIRRSPAVRNAYLGASA